MKVIYTRTMVYIYSKGEQIAIHPRDYRPGKYTKIPEHLCSHHQHYLKRSPLYYIGKAEEKSKVFSILVELMFNDGSHPEVHYKSCDGLLSLCRKTL